MSKLFTLIFALALPVLMGCGPGQDSSEKWPLGWSDTILVASFNVQNFGTGKLGDSQVTETVVSIIRHFDIIALQELRGPTNYVLSTLVKVLNDGQDGPYAFVSGEPVGSSGHLEQYGFIYDRTKVHWDAGDVETYPLQGFVRPPLLARFSTFAGFDFVLATVHVKPDSAEAEIDELVYVMKYGRDRFPSQRDVVLLGDFNADCSYFNESSNDSPARGPDYYWAIGDELDTNVASSECTYDRIVFDPAFTEEDYTGNHGVFRFDAVLGLSGGEAKDVSDHYPVWVEFATTEDSD
jgi:deoxyribonuclease-1-like protein